MNRSDSSLAQFKQRIPADVRALAVGRTLSVPLGSETAHVTITPGMAMVRFSLRTRDPSEAKARQGQAAAAIERTWASLRNSRPVSLDHRQATALAGDLYRAWANGGADCTIAILHTDAGWVVDRSSPEEERVGFEAAVASLDAATENAGATNHERLVGSLVDRLLLAKGIAGVDPETRAILLDAFVLALRDAFAARQRNAEGDYSLDPKASRFPAFDATAAKAPSSPAVPDAKTFLTGLVADWWREAKATGRKPSTHESYRNTVASLVAFLKHDDASRLTPGDIVRFKDYRLATINPRTGKAISAKTVNDSDLSGLKTIFTWAVANGRMTFNPATGITIKLGKARKLRSKGFTEAEAIALLRAAQGYQPRRERSKTTAGKRWVAWLQAYTGARVGEVGQLRKQDLRREGDHYVIAITPEAGTVKTDEARDVVLHPHLIELGFVRFVETAPPGHLFLTPAPSGDVLGPLQGLKNRLAEFAWEAVPDPNVAPTHGWRHRFKTIGLESGIGERVLDAIQGQAPTNVAGTYGDVTIKTMAASMAKFPRVEIDLETASR